MKTIDIPVNLYTYLLKELKEVGSKDIQYKIAREFKNDIGFDKLVELDNKEVWIIK